MNRKQFMDFVIKPTLMVAIGLLIINTLRNRVPGVAAVTDPIVTGL